MHCIREQQLNSHSRKVLYYRCFPCYQRRHPKVGKDLSMPLSISAEDYLIR